jgi:ADP-ribosylation factor-like protein 5B
LRRRRRRDKMGAWMSRVWFLMFPAKEYKIVVVGLDNAGKTTTLYKLHLGEAVTAAPTIGSNVEEVVFKNIRFEVSPLLPSPLFAFFSSLAKFRPPPDLTNDRVAVADLLLCCSVVVVVAAQSCSSSCSR